MDMNIGIYSIEGETDQEKPVKVLETGCRGLTCQMASKDRLYFGKSMGNDESTCAHVFVYSSGYEFIKDIEIEADDCMMQSMALAHDEKFLVCTFQEGNIAIINTEDYSLQIVNPFEDVENIYSTIVLRSQNQNDFFERVVCATSDGCKTAMLSKDGVLQASEQYFPGCNVSNVEKVQDEKVIVILNDEEGISKIYTVDTGTD